ncbi:MAG: cytochrome P450 [Acidimicrobiales bacterium]
MPTHTITRWGPAVEAYRSKALRQALFDESVMMEDVLIDLHGREHRDRRRIENPLFRRDVQLEYERVEFPEVLEAALAPHVFAGRCELLAFGHRVMLNLSCVNAGVDRVVGDEAETERLLELLEEFIEGARIHHYTGDRDAKIAEIAAAVDAFDAEFVGPSLRRRSALLEEGADLPRDVLSALVSNTGLSRDVLARELAFFLTAGASTSAGALTKTMHNVFGWLEERPGDRPRLVDDPAFVRRCILETLRLSPISPIGGRRALEDLELGDGTVVRRGDRVDIHIESANRDPAVFGDRAHDFDPDRALPEGVPLHGLSFGHGMHHCIGQELAVGVDPDGGGFEDRLFGLVGVVVRELARHGVRPDPDDPPEWETTTARTAFRRFPVLLGSAGDLG